MNRKIGTLAACCCLTLLASQATAQSPSSVSGRVIDASTGNPVSSARVEIGADRYVVSAPDGSFLLERVLPGEHEVAVRRVGYTPWRGTVRIPEGALKRVEIHISPIATALPDVEVEAPRAHLAGFFERQKLGLGQFMTRADIDRRKPAHLAEMFWGVNGAHVVPSARGQVVASRRGSKELRGNYCVAAVFLDGAPFQMSTAGLDDINPDIVEAIEYYSSSARIPALFNQAGRSSPAAGIIVGETKCGVVAIWTRTRN